VNPMVGYIKSSLAALLSASEPLPFLPPDVFFPPEDFLRRTFTDANTTRFRFTLISKNGDVETTFG
jgi:hypothetical protein